MDENSVRVAAEERGAQKTRISQDRKGCGCSSCRAGRVGWKEVTFTLGRDFQGHEGGAAVPGRSHGTRSYCCHLLPAMGIPLPAAGEAFQKLE